MFDFGILDMNWIDTALTELYNSTKINNSDDYLILTSDD